MTDAAAPTITLRDGTSMPHLALGTWTMDDGQAETTVAEALQAGYRLIDTAPGYSNETGVGRGVRASGIDRADVWVTTKIGSKSHGFEESQKAFAASLERLGLDYVDLVLIHWPLPAQDLYVDTWRALLKMQQEGLIKVVGVSNFKPAHLQRLMDETGFMPLVNQVQLNPRIPRSEELAFHAKHGIAAECWQPLAKGNDLLDEAPVVAAAARLGSTPGQVVLRWHVQQGLVPVPKTTNSQRLHENIDVFGFELSPEEMASISALDRGGVGAVDSDRAGG